jgi:hypothetical protein
LIVLVRLDSMTQITQTVGMGLVMKELN